MFKIDFDHQPVKNRIDINKKYDSIASAKSEMLKNGYLLSDIELFTFIPLRVLEKNEKMDMRFFDLKRKVV